MADYQDLLVEHADGRARITLNRPDRHNALTPRLERELHDALWDADDDDGVHAIVIRGAGRSFCSGWDLGGAPPDGAAEPDGAPEDDPPRRRRGRRHLDDDAWQLERSQALNLAAFDLHKPVIAQVHGYCLAGGTCIALFCDFVIVADDAVIGFPPARDLGALPSNLWLYHVGPQWAKRLTMTGDTITGHEAAAIGFALKAVPAELLEREVEHLLDRFARIDHHLLSANKRIINLGMELMGARTLQRLAAENDARAHRAPGTSVYFERVAELGVREAVRVRDGQFGDGRARVHEPDVT